jgi:ribulose 1,5-bisphosphate synthetase/thiazole synthase
MLDESYDAIVIEASHHGIIVVNYLANVGITVGVLDRQNTLGGGAIIEIDSAPMFKISF